MFSHFLGSFLIEWIRFAGRWIGSSPCNDLVAVSVKFNILLNSLDKNGNLLVRVYRPGLVGSPHLIPQETTPMAAHRSSTMGIINGPPLSPWKNKQTRKLNTLVNLGRQLLLVKTRAMPTGHKGPTKWDLTYKCASSLPQSETWPSSAPRTIAPTLSQNASTKCGSSYSRCNQNIWGKWISFIISFKGDAQKITMGWEQVDEIRWRNMIVVVVPGKRQPIWFAHQRRA